MKDYSQNMSRIAHSCLSDIMEHFVYLASRRPDLFAMKEMHDLMERHLRSFFNFGYSEGRHDAIMESLKQPQKGIPLQ